LREQTLRELNRGNVVKRSLLPIAIAVACGGCALFNPYVVPKDAQGKLVTARISSVRFVGGVEEAIDYADAWRRAYVRAAAEHSKARNVTAAIILPLTAVSLFYGITDHGSGDRITRMALGGSMLYTGTEFLTSKPRQQLYLAGARALTCAIVATRPYLVTEEWERAFNQKRGVLDDKLIALARANAALGSAIDMAESVDPADSQVKVAKRIHTQASQALTEGRALAQQAGSASMAFQQIGHALLGAVRSITDRVDQELPKTEPDLESLKSLNAGMEGLATTLAGSAWPKPPSEEPASGDFEDAATEQRQVSGRGVIPSAIRRERLKDAQRQVVDAQAELAAAGERLRTDLSTISKLEEATQRLPSCVPADVGVQFTMTPPGDVLTINKGKTAVVFASGGAGVPGYQLSGSNTNAVTIAPNAQRKELLSLTITAVAVTPEGGEPILSVTDGSGLQRRDVRLQVIE